MLDGLVFGFMLANLRAGNPARYVQRDDVASGG